MKFFWKRIFRAKSGADISAESRTDRGNRARAIPESEGNKKFSDSRCGRRAVEKARRKDERSKWWTKKRVVVLTCLAVFISVLAGVFLYIYDIWANPMDQFDTVAKQFSNVEESEAPSASKTGQPATEPPATECPTEDPYDVLVSEADFSILNNIVNIMLIGVDYAQERETWNGKHAYHADVMIVLSVNTVTSEVNLISLPRDTYAKIPGVDGIYKLNASIDCGGGWPTEEGFEKVCEAASWMLGGLPVQYYYAVDMAAVKGLVDSVGGVDFDVDVGFKMQGRSYKTGAQHMDGQAVLDYLRVRKNVGSESGDLNRINRQKRMLVAIFEKIKSSGLLANLPMMLGAFEGDLHTNTTLGQTAGLAAFFYKVDGDKIELNSMDGDVHSIFNWSFVITDQEKRVKIIKDVFGVDVPVYKEYTYASASYLWERMQSKVIASKSKSILDKVKKILKEDKPKPTEEPAATPTAPTVTPTAPAVTPTEPTATPTAPAATPAEQSPEPTATLAETGMKAKRLKQYSILLNPGTILLEPGITPIEYDNALKLYNEANSTYNKLLKSDSTSELRNANTKLKSEIERLCSLFSISKPSWRVNYEENSNEIYVDFR